MFRRAWRQQVVLCGVLICSAGVAPAQDDPVTDSSAKSTATRPTIETIVVTGTRGAERSVLTTPVPIDVITRGQIASAGALGGEFGQALQNLVPSFNFQRQSNSGAADIVRPAQLRGMSPDQVLVLINGKRRHTTSITGIDAKTGRGTAPVDFNSIPNNAIRRVEVLRDGAGAQYGSDAIAGVPQRGDLQHQVRGRQARRPRPPEALRRRQGGAALRDRPGPRPGINGDCPRFQAAKRGQSPLFRVFP